MVMVSLTLEELRLIGLFCLFSSACCLFFSPIGPIKVCLKNPIHPVLLEKPPTPPHPPSHPSLSLSLTVTDEATSPSRVSHRRMGRLGFPGSEHVVDSHQTPHVFAT